MHSEDDSDSDCSVVGYDPQYRIWSTANKTKRNTKEVNSRCKTQDVLSNSGCNSVTCTQPSVSVSHSPSDTERDAGDSNDVAICEGGPDKGCGKPVTNEDHGVKCEKCTKWYHAQCQKTSEQEYAFLNKGDRLTWLCLTCKDNLKIPSSSPCTQSPGLKQEIDQLRQILMEQSASLKKVRDSPGLKGEIDGLRQMLVEQSASLRQMCKSPGLKEEIGELRQKLVDHSASLRKVCEGQKKMTDATGEGQKKLERMVKEHSKFVDVTAKGQVKHQASYASILKGSCEEVVNTINTKITSAPRGAGPGGPDSTQQIAGMFDSYFEKDRKRKNVVVYNLTEEEGLTYQEGIKKDIYKFEKLVQDEFKMRVRVSKCHRAGKPSPGKDRLLIVSLDDEATKWDILKQAPLLRASEEYPRVFINPDLSLREREEAKKLRDEMKHRQEQGETHLMIKHGRIVPRQHPGATTRQRPEASTNQRPEATRRLQPEAQDQPPDVPANTAPVPVAPAQAAIPATHGGDQSGTVGHTDAEHRAPPANPNQAGTENSTQDSSPGSEQRTIDHAQTQPTTA